MPVSARALAAALAAALLLGAGHSRAQQAPPPPPVPVPAGDTMVSLDFQDADITEVISTIAKATGKNFLYDDRVRGRVTVISPEPVTVDEAYRVFESILAVKGFTTVPAPGGVLKILPLRDAKENPIETVVGERPTENRDTFITRLLPLHYVKADAIGDTLKPLVSKEATVIPYGPTNTLILTDSAANIRRLANIISEIDVSTYQQQIKLIPIQYADASQLTQQLTQIFNEDSGGGAPGQPGLRRARAVTQTPNPAVPGVPGAESTGVSEGEPRFIPDDRTNSIVVIATKSILHEVERIITLLDYKRKGAGRIHVYRLKNADADEIAQTLSSLASGSAGGGLRPTGGGLGGGLGGTRRTSLTGLGGTSQSPAGSALGGLGTSGLSAGQASAVAELGDGVRITADAPTNSLIIQASAEAFATISEVIDALDVRRPQVMVEALIMEVNATPTQDLGAGWITNMATKDGSIIGIGSESPNGDSATGLTSGVAADLANGLSNPGRFTTALLGKTITIPNPDPNAPAGSTIKVPVIQGVITASATEQNANIISAPTILTADKKEAEIVVGQNIPVPTSRLQAATPTTDPNNPFQTSQNIARQDVGVTLRVTPQISEGDTVRLNVFQEISEVAANDSTLGPTTTNRKVENTVYVRDGEAVMIGGILSELQNSNENKVPWLGDIPILGWAFKGTHEDGRKTNLLVLLTPRIVRDPQDLERLTVENRERFKSASAPAIDLTTEEKEERRKALEAGIPLPIDPNPVRRELERHDQKYPVETLPQLREDAVQREQHREQEIESLKKKEASGSYLVQVAHFSSAEEAVALLQKLMADGYDGTVLSQSEQGETTHWVQLGPYTNEAKAQSVARDLTASRGLPALVVVAP
jgi:general secretion pathway protein D